MHFGRLFTTADTLGPAFAVFLFVSFVLVPVPDVEPPNSAPEVDSVVSTLNSLFPTQSCDIRCAARDADGDALTVTWSASGGTLEPRAEAARWTAPDRPGSYSVVAEVEDGNGGHDTGILVILVTPNAPPVVESISAEPALVLPGATVKVNSSATDPDGHALGYEWSSPDGTFAGIGPTVTWTAPSTPGSYPVNVRAYDGLGGDASASALVTVASPDPPVIEAIIVRPFVPEYTKAYDWGYRILRGKLCECEIECVASAGDKELFYEWSTTEGSIEGEGAAVLFVPPSKTTVVEVTVTVSDAFGHSAADHVIFRVFLREPYAFGEDEDPAGCGCGR